MNTYDNDYSYTYPVARIHTIETKLFTKQDVSRLLDLPDTNSIISFLQNVNYGTVDTKQKPTISAFIVNEIKNVFKLIFELTPEKDIHLIQLLYSEYDFHNFKVVTTRKSFNLPGNNGLVDLGNIHPALFETSLPEPFDLLSRQITTFKPDTPVKLNSLIEKFKWEYLIKNSKKNLIFQDLFRLSCNLVNLRVFLFSKSFNIPQEEFELYLIDDNNNKIFKDIYSKSWEIILQYFKLTQYNFITEQPTLNNSFNIEKLCDDYFIEYLQEKSKYCFFNISPLLNYIYMKKYETQMLQTIWHGKLNQLTTDKIKSRLRKIYT